MTNIWEEKLIWRERLIWDSDERRDVTRGRGDITHAKYEILIEQTESFLSPLGILRAVDVEKVHEVDDGTLDVINFWIRIDQLESEEYTIDNTVHTVTDYVMRAHR